MCNAKDEKKMIKPNPQIVNYYPSKKELLLSNDFEYSPYYNWFVRGKVKITPEYLNEHSYKEIEDVIELYNKENS